LRAAHRLIGEYGFQALPAVDAFHHILYSVFIIFLEEIVIRNQRPADGYQVRGSFRQNLLCTL
jgi:hypothetical protein